MTKSGIAYKFGDIVLVDVPFTDSTQAKLRPALVLFEEFDNVVVCGITSNQHMQGIKLYRHEGLVKDSVFLIYKYS